MRDVILMFVRQCVMLPLITPIWWTQTEVKLQEIQEQKERRFLNIVLMTCWKIVMIRIYFITCCFLSLENYGNDSQCSIMHSQCNKLDKVFVFISVSFFNFLKKFFCPVKGKKANGNSSVYLTKLFLFSLTLNFLNEVEVVKKSPRTHPLQQQPTQNG